MFYLYATNPVSYLNEDSFLRSLPRAIHNVFVFAEDGKDLVSRFPKGMTWVRQEYPKILTYIEGALSYPTLNQKGKFEYFRDAIMGSMISEEQEKLPALEQELRESIENYKIFKPYTLIQIIVKLQQLGEECEKEIRFFKEKPTNSEKLEALKRAKEALEKYKQMAVKEKKIIETRLSGKLNYIKENSDKNVQCLKESKPILSILKDQGKAIEEDLDNLDSQFQEKERLLQNKFNIDIFNDLLKIRDKLSASFEIIKKFRDLLSWQEQIKQDMADESNYVQRVQRLRSLGVADESLPSRASAAQLYKIVETDLKEKVEAITTLEQLKNLIEDKTKNREVDYAVADYKAAVEEAEKQHPAESVESFLSLTSLQPES